MEIETVVSLVSSVGFPIVCVIFLWKYVSTQLREFNQVITENTMVLQKVYERLDMLGRDTNENHG